MQVPHVTVVVPTWNRRELLGETLATVRAQDGVRLQLIVVDDASTDGTAEWLAPRLDAATERLIVLAQNARKVGAVNAGIAAADAPLLMVFDCDDWMLPGALAHLAQRLLAAPAAVAVIGALLRDVDGADRRMNHPTRPRLRSATHELLAGWSAVPGQALVRTNDLRAGGDLTHPAPCEDRALLLALAARGPFLLDPRPVMRYRVHAGQVGSSATQEERERVYADALERMTSARARSAGRRATRAGRHWREGDAALLAGSRALALARYAAAALTAPRVASSPLIWPALGRGALAALRPGATTRRPW